MLACDSPLLLFSVVKYILILVSRYGTPNYCQSSYTHKVSQLSLGFNETQMNSAAKVVRLPL